MNDWDFESYIITVDYHPKKIENALKSLDEMLLKSANKEVPHFSLPNVKLSITYCGVQLPSLRMYCITVAVPKLLFSSFMYHTSLFWFIKAGFLHIRLGNDNLFGFAFFDYSNSFSDNHAMVCFIFIFRYAVQILVPQSCAGNSTTANLLLMVGLFLFIV